MMGELNAFQSLWADARAQLDGVFGELIAIMPRAKHPDDPDARSIADPARPAMTVIGIWDDKPSEKYPHSRLIPDKNSHQVADEDVVLTLARSRLPYLPRQGDRVMRMLTGDVFAISDVQDSTEVEWLINLSSRAS